MTIEDYQIDIIERTVEKVAVQVGLSMRRQHDRAGRLYVAMKTADPDVQPDDASRALWNHQVDVMRRWLARGIARMPVDVLPVDDPVVDFSDTVGDDFIRNRARYRASVRAIKDPPEYYRDRGLRVARGTHVVRFSGPAQPVSIAAAVLTADQTDSTAPE